MGNCTNSTMNLSQGNMVRQYSNRNMAEHNLGSSMHHLDTCDNRFPIGMAYVPWQTWRNIYEPDKALQRGTIFEELDKPFYGAQGVKR